MRAGWIVGLAVMSAGVTAADPALTPRSIRQSIHERGARRTIEDLYKRGKWEAVTDAMDAGGTSWIALAPLLAGGSDAGSAEDLGLSLAFALPRNPRAVLAALDVRDGHILGPGRVCGRPFIEDTEPRRYKSRTLAALSTVRKPGLIGRKAACLRILNATR